MLPLAEIAGCRAVNLRHIFGILQKRLKGRHLPGALIFYRAYSLIKQNSLSRNEMNKRRYMYILAEGGAPG